MKCICIGRNYAAHAAELGNAVPEEPVVFLKPDTAVLRQGDDFFIPNFSQDIHYEAELVFRVGAEGKYIRPEFVWKHLDAVTVGIDFTARDLQNQLKSKGLPWERAKAFNTSAAPGKMKPLAEIGDVKNLSFSLKINGEMRQQGHISQMLFDIPRIVAFVSEYFMLKTGDLIFTGTPPGVGPVKAGDLLEGFLGNDQVLKLKIR